MSVYEVYKPNVEVEDPYNIKNDVIGRNMMCRLRHLKIINRRLEGAVKDDYFKQPLAAAVLGVYNAAAPTDRSAKVILKHRNTWCDADEQKLYLKTKPNCYFIIGKPGLKSYELGEKLSEKLKCIHICPKNVIMDEIEQKSPTGKCIEFNMKHLIECKINTIMPIIKRKIESPAVKHRGYVLSGLPMISTERSELSFFRKLYPEEAVNIVDELLNEFVMNLKKKKKKDKSAATSTSSFSSAIGEAIEEEANEEEQEEINPEEEEEEENQVVELPKFLLEPCEDVIHSKRNYYDSKKITIQAQINQILKLEMRPDIVIHMTCPDEDAVALKSHKYLNYKSGKVVIDPFISTPITEQRWPPKYSLRDFSTEPESNDVSNKYLVRQPINYTENSVEQLCTYRKYFLPFWERKINDINPRYIIKVDGRRSVDEILHHVNERLEMIIFHFPILIPQPLQLEEPPEDMEDFWKLVQETKIVEYGDLSFNRFPSHWYNRCPVELHKRLAVRGKIKYAVSFFKHVFLLSSYENFVAFYKNPRPYLCFDDLEPTCRFIVMGTKLSGKTMISECLSWLFDSEIITYDTIYETEKEKKYNKVAETLFFPEVITKVELERLEKWEIAEKNRQDDLMAWQKSTLPSLKRYVAAFREREAIGKRQEDADRISKLDNLLRQLREQLSTLPFLNDLDQCQSVLASKMLEEYAPAKLTIILENPVTPVFGDEDVTKAISEHIIENDLQNEVEPTSEEIMSVIVNMIQSIDAKSLKESSCYGKYIIDGFPPDPNYWSVLTESKLLPDYTITIIENKQIDQDLFLQYMKIENIDKDHQERFKQADDPFILLRKGTAKIFQSNQTLVFSYSAPDIHIGDKIAIDHSFHQEKDFSIEAEEDLEVDEEKMNAFSQSIDKFREDWESTKAMLEENHKAVIEVEIDTKSDVEIVEDILLQLRKAYVFPCESFEAEEAAAEEESEEELPKDYNTYNDTRFMCETGIYCPIAFYDYSVLWKGKSEFCLKYGNKLHYFSKEECLEKFRKDPTKYQAFSKPFKHIPPFRICIIGSAGCGASSISKFAAKEMGLIHIDIVDAFIKYMLPRHYKKVGRKYEDFFSDPALDEEAVVEFQMNEENENLVSDIISNETEMRRMVYNYFERGTPMLSALMQQLIKKIWFEKPFITSGFILDGYPRLPEDVEDMVACYCIPDLIIELESSSETAIDRLVPGMLKKWKTAQTEERLKAQKRFDYEKTKWSDFVAKEVIIKVTIDDLLENVVTIAEPQVELPEVQLSNMSTMMDADPSGPESINPNLISIYNEVIEQNPAPVNTTEWEKTEDARERFESRIEAVFETGDEGIQSMKELLSEHNIKCVTIDATSSFSRTSRKVLLKLSPLRNRCALFEQTFVISIDVAETLLSEGFYFLSKFGRMGPIYIHLNPTAIRNPYKIKKSKGGIVPTIHRSYIYFIVREKVKQFRRSPLMSVVSKAIEEYHEYPLGIAVIGPPKSGKSTLASKLANHYGLTCVSKGMAIRNILEKLHWTRLATIIRKTLEDGKCVEYDHIIQAVQTALIDYRTDLHGFVLDGLPEFASEAIELHKAGIYPLVIFDLSTNKDKLVQSSQNEVYNNILKYLPPYSQPYIKHVFSEWSDKSYLVREFISRNCQNITEIDGNQSKWQCWQNAQSYIENFSPKLHYYMANQNSDLVLPINMLSITNHDFQKKFSPCQDFCPVCLRKKFLRNSRPVDRKGMVQYLGLYYWVCPEHMEIVLKDPENHLTTRSEIPLLPAAVKHFHVDSVYENGVCIVTYAENLPAQIFKRGSNKYAVVYKKRVYLLCTEECKKKFMERPHLYYDIQVFKETKGFPQICLKKLPNIGYLEQTVGEILTNACCAVNVLRPLYPGLDQRLSAVLYIGLYLKVNNPNLSKSFYPLYKKALDVYEARSKFLISLGLRLRSADNPFVTYPECCNKRTIMYSDSEISKISEDKQTVMPKFRSGHSDEDFDFY